MPNTTAFEIYNGEGDVQYLLLVQAQHLIRISLRQSPRPLPTSKANLRQLTTYMHQTGCIAVLIIF